MCCKNLHVYYWLLVVIRQRRGFSLIFRVFTLCYYVVIVFTYFLYVSFYQQEIIFKIKSVYIIVLGRTLNYQRRAVP